MENPGKLFLKNRVGGAAAPPLAELDVPKLMML